MNDGTPDITVKEAYEEIKRRFFQNIEADEWKRRTLGQVFRSLCSKAKFPIPLSPSERKEGFWFKMPDNFPLKGYTREAYLATCDFLLEEDTRAAATYVRGGISRGTAPIHVMHRDVLENILGWMEQRLVGKDITLPRIPAAKTKTPMIRRADIRYSDTEGTLKRALCLGLRIDVETCPHSFIDLFRQQFTRDLIVMGTNNDHMQLKLTGSPFEHLSFSGKPNTLGGLIIATYGPAPGRNVNSEGLKLNRQISSVFKDTATKSELLTETQLFQIGSVVRQLREGRMPVVEPFVQTEQSRATR